MKRLLTVGILILSFCFLVGCSQTADQPAEQKEAKIEIVDDSGKTINLDQPAKRIISLYSAHTENLFALGLDEEIIGVGKSDAYPPAVKTKEVFDYNSDPEKVIAANPDLVLIRPNIQKSAPNFVEALEMANIKVVSLYPDQFADFVPYIKNLALLTGTEENAEKAIEKFNKDLHEIENLTAKIEPKVRVYFESTENKCRTVTPDSMAAHAIKLAGGINVAADATPVRKGSSIAAYGEELILDKASEIDVYVAQKGAMNSEVTAQSIAKRLGFNTIKAVKEGKVYIIDEKIVSSPTFRFAQGVRELAEAFYPEIGNL